MDWKNSHKSFDIFADLWLHRKGKYEVSNMELGYNKSVLCRVCACERETRFAGKIWCKNENVGFSLYF